MQIELKSGRKIIVKGLTADQKAEICDMMIRDINDYGGKHISFTTALKACRYGLNLNGDNLDDWEAYDLLGAGAEVINLIQIDPLNKKKLK